MKTFLFLFAVLFFWSQPRMHFFFFDEKCSRINGRCTASCLKNEELVALCWKNLKCCVTVQSCGRSKGNQSDEGSGHMGTRG
ncbi:beta-defensin 34 precursor [Mus musculus]|uniref:Beta-defensin 34 n=1 Tax=Mus musculus TaxID=10090 RepID=DFB34_MOUSE|eukprot:NP_898856.1 beta-defensin 34 precursor [Mus musculus]